MRLRQAIDWRTTCSPTQGADKDRRTLTTLHAYLGTYVLIAAGSDIVTSEISNRINQWSHSSAREQRLCFDQRFPQTRPRALSHDVTPQEINGTALLMFV
jgi:hypothetical protein